jgi:hypothetical protein
VGVSAVFLVGGFLVVGGCVTGVTGVTSGVVVIGVVGVNTLGGVYVPGILTPPTLIASGVDTLTLVLMFGVTCGVT